MSTKKREPLLVLRASPCDCNLYPTGAKSLEEVRHGGRSFCPRYQVCTTDGPEKIGDSLQCCMQIGTKVAQFVLQGGTLEGEMLEFRREYAFPVGGMIHSHDRETFTIITSRDEAYQKVEEFAKMLVASVRGDEAPHVAPVVGPDFANVIASAMTASGAIDLRAIDRLEGRFAHLPHRNRRCDVMSGPCACGAYH